MSTLDTQTYLFASTVADGLKARSSAPQPTTIAVVSAAFVAALVLVSLFIGDIVQFLFNAVTLGTVLAPVFAAAFLPKHLRPSDTAAATAIAIGALGYIGLFAFGVFATHLLFTAVPATLTLASMAVAVFGRE